MPPNLVVGGEPKPGVPEEILRWRVGRKVGRTIYAQAGESPSDADVLIGVMDRPTLAAAAVMAHNATLEVR
ncbi:MAG TPA: hypothetical protein VJP59_05955 [Gemmatimonadota bacterium]|nr:hypothetical protein [Gemmatimonadota bacterium]